MGQERLKKTSHAIIFTKAHHEKSKRNKNAGVAHTGMKRNVERPWQNLDWGEGKMMGPGRVVEGERGKRHKKVDRRLDTLGS